MTVLILDRRTLLITAFTAGLAFCTASAIEPGVLRIGYQKSGILVVAKQNSVIEAAVAKFEHRVRWVEFSFGPPLLEALSLDGIDFGQTGDAPPIFAQAAHANLIYAAAQEASGSGAGILPPKDSSIQTLTDLKGKRSALAKTSSAHNLTLAALKKAGLTYADIDPVTLAPADAAAAFARGNIDAWTIWDPYFAIAEVGDTARVLATADDIAKQNNFFVGSRELAEVRPVILGAVVDVLGNAARWCSRHRTEVASLLSQGIGVLLSATQRAVDRNDHLMGPMSERVVLEQQAIADRFHALKLIPKPIRVANAVWTNPDRG